MKRFVVVFGLLILLVVGCGTNPVAEEHGKADGCEYSEQGEVLRCEHTWDAHGQGV